MRSDNMTISRDTPFVSVIMPVRNEALFIERSISALLRQHYPVDRMEIIIADGMSIDGTRAVISRIAGETVIPIRVVDNPKRIAPSGLNRAISAAAGDIIVRVDGHCEVDSSYVENIVEILSEGRAEGVGGPIETVGETPHARAIALAMSSWFGVGGSAFRTVNDREIFTDTVAFPGYSREIIEKAGPFNEELVRNQDDEYNFRIRKLGGRILLSPLITSRYYSRSTFRSLWRQYYQYGYWKVRVLQLHPRQMSARQFIPFGFVLWLLLLSMLSIWVPALVWLLAGTAAVYLTADLTASAFSARYDIRLLPRVMIANAILHFSYGIGFLVGLLHFWNCWNKAAIEDIRTAES